MTTTIKIEQNSDRNIKLLAAQQQLYTEAKRLRSVRLISSVLLAVAAPFIVAFQPGWNTTLGVIGAIWLMLDQAVLKHIQNSTVRQAAVIQEEFDTNIFNLPWNPILVGDRVPPESVTSASGRFKRDKEKLRDWYPDMGSVPYPFDVLICQRFNLVWDWQLRRNYAAAILVTVAIYIGFLIWFAIYRDLLVIEAVLLFLPATSAIAEGIGVAIDHIQLASEKESTSKTILSLWESGIKNSSTVSAAQCRVIQDCIYNYRSKGPLVPNWWYDWLRSRYEVNMQNTAEELRAEAEKRFCQ